MWPPSSGGSGIRLNSPIVTLIRAKKARNPSRPSRVRSLPIDAAPMIDDGRDSSTLLSSLDAEDDDEGGGFELLFSVAWLSRGSPAFQTWSAKFDSPDGEKNA